MLKMDEYLRYDAIGLAELVRTKQVNAKELLDVALERYQQTNPKLNAVIIPMIEYAQQKVHQQQMRGPFAGVPFLVKDLFQEFKGIQTSYGSTPLKNRHYTPDFNAEIVNRWERAGLITFGRTNTPEFGIKGITEPEAWGACKNPWNLKHNSGGSSGGSASAVAAGIVPIAGAGDGGGSIRIPASYCGLFGLKPSRGRTPWGPDVGEAMHGAAMQHVLSRTVRDSAALLDATHGFDAANLFKIPDPEISFLQAASTPPRKLKIAFNTRSPIGTKVSKDAILAIEQTVKLLESLGHEVIEDAPNIHGMELAKDFITTWFSQFSYIMQQLQREYGIKTHEYELDSVVLGAFGARTLATDYIHTQHNWAKYTHQLNLFFDKYDLYLTPTTASVAPLNGQIATPAWQRTVIKSLLKVGKAHLLAKGILIDHMVKENLSWVPFTQLANITGTPAMSVPLYWNKDGLPLGSQFIAPFGDEALLLSLAGQLETAKPWSEHYFKINIA